jgi:hypothetical protein
LSWFEDVYRCCNSAAAGVTATQLPSHPASGPSPPLLPLGFELWVGVLTALNTGDQAAILVAAAAKWTLSAALMDATLAVSNNSYTWFPAEPKKSTKVEN